jgi:hypothetical protein
MIRVDADRHCLERKDLEFRSASFAGELSGDIRISLVPLDFVKCVVCTVTYFSAKVEGKEDSK